MVAIRHCCWGKCNSDSRYPEWLPDSLKETLKNGKKAFIPFSKPKHDLELSERWINECSRQTFFVKNVNCNTYICAVHWPGGKGPTKVSLQTRLKRIYRVTLFGRMAEWWNGMAEHPGYSKIRNTRYILKHGKYCIFWKAEYTEYSKMCYREEIIQSDSPLGDMFPRFRFCAPRTAKHRRRTFSHSEKEKWRKTLTVSISIILKTWCTTCWDRKSVV